jgi:pyridoxine kinase
MAKILSFSSQVLYGHVGNSVTGFVLQRLGHDVLSLPAILLSNRLSAKRGTRRTLRALGSAA